MGRKPTRNTNLPAGMRARHRGAKTYYFYDLGGKPRKELSLGTDYVEAVRKWSELEKSKTMPAPIVTFDTAANGYVADVLPTKSPRTLSDNVK